METEEAAGAGRETDWYELQRIRKKRAALFTLFADLLERLVCARVGIDLGLSIIGDHLLLSSVDWEKQQVSKANSPTGQRTFPVVEIAKGSLLKSLHDRVIEKMWQVPEALHHENFTRRPRSSLFRMLSALVASMEAFSGRFHRSFPFAIFKLLDNDCTPSTAADIYKRRRCLRDDLAKQFFQLFPSETKGTSAAAAAWLQCVAYMVRLDIANVECVHSSIREFTKQRARGHTAPLTTVAAKVLCRWMAATHGAPPEDDEKGDDTHPEPEPESKAKVVKGGGGPWRAYCAERSAGQKLTRDYIRTLASEYRALTHDEFQHYKELGLRMTLQSRYARLRANMGSVPGVTGANDGSGSGNHVAGYLQSSSDLLLQLGSNGGVIQLLALGSDFEERYKEFNSMLRDEGGKLFKANRLERKQQEEVVKPCSDAAIANAVLSHGGPSLLEGLAETSLGSGHLVSHYHWKMPVCAFTKVGYSVSVTSYDYI